VPIFALLILLLLGACGPSAPAKLPPTNAVIIVRTMFDPDEKALLITDRKAIDELRDVVAANPHAVEHACGFHWLICFRDATGQVAVFAHNEECEEYERNWKVHRVLKRYFNRIRRHPMHFAFDVTVPSSLAPEQLVASTTRGPELVFFLNGTDLRLPHVKLRLTETSAIPDDRSRWDAAVEANRARGIARMTAIVAGVEKRIPGAHHTKIDNPGSMFGGTIEDQIETTIYFPYGTPIPDVPPVVTIIEREVPASYNMQVIGLLRSAPEVKAVLEVQLQTPVTVTPYR
jgi:hypothetical protein